MTNLFKASYTIKETGQDINGYYRAIITHDQTGDVVSNQKLELDFSEIARLQTDREEMMIKNAPHAAKQWGYVDNGTSSARREQTQLSYIEFSDGHNL